MSDFRRIGATVRREQKRLWNSCPELGMTSAWQRAAGSEIASHATVKSMRDGILTVICDSGAWACELKLHAGELVQKINQSAPPEQVREIRFTSGVRGGSKYRK